MVLTLAFPDFYRLVRRPAHKQALAVFVHVANRVNGALFHNKGLENSLKKNYHMGINVADSFEFVVFQTPHLDHSVLPAAIEHSIIRIF